MFAKSAALLPGDRRRRSSRDRRPRAGLFSGKGFLQRNNGEARRRDEEDDDDLDPVSSSSTEESETFHDAKVRAENLEDYEPSELVHGLISESSSGDTSSSEDTAGEQSMEPSVEHSVSVEQSVEQSVVYVESEEDDAVGVGGILQMGCMDGFFMPGRAGAAKKSLIGLNEKGEKELKFNMKLPIATGFQNQIEKEQSENRNKSNQRGVDADGRSATPSLSSVLHCRPNNCRTDHDIQEALDGFSVSSIRDQPTMDPPAKVAGADPSEQFKSLMSLSHDGSSNDDDSHSYIRAENLVLPPHPPTQQYQMHAQSHYMHNPHAMMQGGGAHMHHTSGWHQHNMHPPHQQQPPVTVNNTYEMLVVNGMMPQQQYQVYGVQQNYWNYMQNPALGHHHRPMEPPAIEKLPSQILVQKEDQTIGEDSSYLSYENVPVSNALHPPPTMQYQKVQHTKHHFGARVLQSSQQHPHINAPYTGQIPTMHANFPVKGPPQYHHYKAATGNQRQIQQIATGSTSEDSSRQGESDDEFQDSVQVLPEDHLASSHPKHDEKSHSSASSGGKPPRVHRWRQANLRRLKAPPPSTSSRPPLVPPVPSTRSKSNSPSFDETPPVRHQKQEEASVASSRGGDIHDDPREDIDDDETVDSEMAIVDTQNIQVQVKKDPKPDPERLQPVVEEDSKNSSDDGSTDSESTGSNGSSSSESSASESSEIARSPPEKDTKENCDPENAVPVERPVSVEPAIEKPKADEKAEEGDKQSQKSGSFLMFDSIYTRRRERRDAAKLKMSKFLESKKAEKMEPAEREKPPKRTTTRLSRLSRMINHSNLSSESGNNSPTSEEQTQASLGQPNSLTATPQTDNKKNSPPPPIETTGSADAVFQNHLDVPGLNSPAKRSIQGPESPSKRVSMSPLARTSSIDNSIGIKMSLSLKPTMTSEFHDAMSTSSDEISSAGIQSLRIQPTMTNEWHDAVDTMQSPTSVSASKQHEVGMSMTEESLPVDEPPALKTPPSPKATAAKVTKSSSNEENSSVDLTLKKRSSDHDEYFEATCVVD
jgi:hypothetical protein